MPRGERGDAGAMADAGLADALLRLNEPSLRRLAIAEALAKANFNPDEPRDRHGRWTTGGDSGSAAGVRPGPSPARLVPTAAEEESEPGDAEDPLAPLRRALWNDGIRTLRLLDPDNPELTYLSNPGSAPDAAALDRLDAAIRAAAIGRVQNKVMPGGMPIGQPGRGSDVRESSGGLNAAKDLFNYLRVGGTPYRSEPDMTIIALPGNAGYITFRPVSSSGDPAININVPGAEFKIHFPDGE